MEIAMVIFGILTVMTACGVVLSRKTLHSALWLVATLFLVAVHFAILGADFIAALQVLIYAGAIMVLVVFVIMLLGIDQAADARAPRSSRILAGVFCGLFVAVLLVAVSSEVVIPLAREFGGAPLAGSPTDVGRLLVTKYLYAFEISALLLLAAVVGAVLLAYEGKRPLAPGRGLRAMHQQDDLRLTEKESPV